MNDEMLQKSVQALLDALDRTGEWLGYDVENAMDLCRAAMGDPDAIEYLQRKIKKSEVLSDLALFLDVLMIEPRELPPEEGQVKLGPIAEGMMDLYAKGYRPKDDKLPPE